MADIEEGIRPNLAPLCNKYSIISSVHRSATNIVIISSVVDPDPGIRKFLALPDPSIIKQKEYKKTLIYTVW